MYRIGRYDADDRMCDLVCDSYPVLLVMSRFGIALGFGDKTIGEVCRDSGVDTGTFLTVVNTHIDGEAPDPGAVSVGALVGYLRNSHDYFLDFRLPGIRRKLIEAIDCSRNDVAFAILRFFDEYVAEVHKHMDYEEHKVFPYVEALLAGERPEGYSIDVFRRHHDQVEAKLAELKRIIIRYYPSGSTNELNGVLFDIFTCERDLASHNDIEDRLFIPAIKRLEEAGETPDDVRSGAETVVRCERRRPMKALKLAVAESSAILRCGIIALLHRMPAANVDILEIGDISQLVAQLSRHRPDVLIVNPASLGLCTPQQLRAQTGCEGMRCVALQLAMTDAVTLGAYDEVLSIYDSEDCVRRKIVQPADEAPRGERQEPLSVREREIVVCIVKGMSNKQIADTLCISTHTVITHRRNIVAKLQIHSPAGLTIYAIVNKLVDLSEIRDTITEI